MQIMQTLGDRGRTARRNQSHNHIREGTDPQIRVLLVHGCLAAARSPRTRVDGSVGRVRILDMQQRARMHVTAYMMSNARVWFCWLCACMHGSLLAVVWARREGDDTGRGRACVLQAAGICWRTYGGGSHLGARDLTPLEVARGRVRERDD